MVKPLLVQSPSMTIFRITNLPRLMVWFCLAGAVMISAFGQSAQRLTQEYSIPSGDAATTLDVFARQSGEQVIFLVDVVAGQTTRPVRGRFSSFEALQRMLLGTQLSILRDGSGGPMTVARRTDARPSRTGHPELVSGADTTTRSEPVVLPEFTVSETSVDRYRGADAISAMRVRAALIDTPSSITVLTRDVIDDLAPTRIFDVARYVAGVQEGRGIQFQDRMILRGFESNGQRTVDNFLQPDDADNIDEVVVDRIEITKGPNAILSPAGAPGGSVNIITKSPSYQNNRVVTGTAGLFDAQKISLDFTGPMSADGKIAYRLIASFQDSRRYWSNEARLRGKVLAPMLSFRVSDRTQLTLKLIAAEHWVFREPLLILDPSVTGGTSQPRLAPGLSRRGLNGVQPWSHVGTHTADLSVLLTHTLTENISVRFAGNGRYYFEDSIQEFLSTPSFSNRYNPATGELTQDYTWSVDTSSGAYASTYSPFFDPSSIPVRGDKQTTRRKTVGVQADAVVKYRFGHWSSQTVTGFALSRRTNYGRGVSGALPGIDLGEPSLRFEPLWSSDWSFNNDSQFTNWQFYVNERIGMWSDRLQITGGMLHYDTDTYARNHLISAPPGTLRDSKPMWMASALLKPRENVSLYYSHSTNSSPVIANNLPLWRDGVQNEIGLKSEFFEQRLSLAAAFFKIAQTNITVPNPDRQTDPTAPESLVSDLGNHGVEIEAIGGLTPSLSLIATFTQLKMRDNLGRHVRAVADRNAALLLNYRFRTGALSGLSTHLGFSYSGRRAGDTPINFTPLNAIGRTSFFLRPYYVTTLGAAYRWGEKYLVRLNIDNLFDDKGYIQQAGGRVSGTGITTAPGINVKFSVSASF
jgi:iron complex outermembrane receptor protein